MRVYQGRLLRQVVNVHRHHALRLLVVRARGSAWWWMGDWNGGHQCGGAAVKGEGRARVEGIRRAWRGRGPEGDGSTLHAGRRGNCHDFTTLSFPLKHLLALSMAVPGKITIILSHSSLPSPPSLPSLCAVVSRDEALSVWRKG